MASQPLAQRFAVYVINLDRSADRLAHMGEELARAGLTFERAPGILGAELSGSMKPWFFGDDGAFASPLKPGEIGCDAAHLSVHLRMASGEYAPLALILEDDVRIDPKIAEVIESALASLPDGWDILRLSNAPKRAYAVLADLPGGARLVRYSKIPNSAAAYLLNLSGARKLAKPRLRTRVIDEFLRRPWLAGVDTWGVVAPPIQDGVFDSTIDAQSPRRYGPRAFDPIAMLKRSALADLPAMIRWNIRALGMTAWLACGLINAADRIARKLVGETIIHRLAPRLRSR